MEIIKREYTLDTASTTTQYEAICSDLQGWYNWDTVGPSANNTVFMKMFEGGMVGLQVKMVMQNQASGGVEIIPINSKGSSGITVGGFFESDAVKFIHAVKLGTGIAFITSPEDSPSSENGGTFFYIGELKNAVDGTTAPGMIAHRCRSNSKQYIVFGKSSESTQAANFEWFVHPAVNVSGILQSGCLDYPEKIYRTSSVPAVNAAVEKVRINGKAFVRMGLILIPEEE